MAIRNHTKKYVDIRMGYKITKSLNDDIDENGFGDSLRKRNNNSFGYIKNDSNSNSDIELDEMNDSTTLLNKKEIYDNSNIYEDHDPEWVEVVKQSEIEISMIEKLTSDLNTLHRNRLKNQFDEINMNQQDKDIEKLTSNITARFRTIEKNLKQLNQLKMKNISKNKQHQEVQLKIQQNIQNNFAKKIQSLTVAFRSSQKVGIRNTYLSYDYFIVYPNGIYIDLYVQIGLFEIKSTLTIP